MRQMSLPHKKIYFTDNILDNYRHPETDISIYEFDIARKVKYVEIEPTIVSANESYKANNFHMTY